MANTVVADTDILIDYAKGVAPGADLVQRLGLEGRLAISAISVFELRAGAPGDQMVVYQPLLDGLVLDTDRQVGLVAGAIAADLEARGSRIGAADCLIAGTCISYGLPLATRNRAHFERIEGLELVDF